MKQIEETKVLDKQRGVVIVISAPSGTGKSTVCKRLCELHPDISLSISYTTRRLRNNERNGKEYHFVDDATFTRMVHDRAFLEYAQVHGNQYGSCRADVELLLAQQKNVLFDIDVQGGEQIKRAIPEARLVFLLPPSIDELLHRIQTRGTESVKQIKTRLHTALHELECAQDYDYYIVNNILDQTVDKVYRIRQCRSTILQTSSHKIINNYINDLSSKLARFLSSK